MLAELVIENYAVIERIRVRFPAGLNVLTGETGSGKSIVVDALGLLLGGRASPDMVRTGAAAARVSGIFEIGKRDPARRLLESAGFEIEEDEVLIEREIQVGGKSRAFLASRPVTVTLLRELAPHLADIHGQHDQQELFVPAAQRQMLDAFAGAGLLREQVAAAWQQWRACQAELEELERLEQDKLRMTDLWSFQRREIEEAAPKPGEDAALEAERRRLRNVARLQEAATAAYEALYESPDSALARLRSAGRRIEELARVEPELASLADGLRAAELAAEETALALRDYLSRLEASPERLEEVEARLALLDKLKRKYGATLEHVLAYLEEIRQQLEAAENAEARRAGLRRQLERLAGTYEEAANRLSARRRQAAGELEACLQQELAALAMEGTVFRVELSSGPWTPAGTDEIRFLVSPNLGEAPRPLEQVASGGELSRIALALKTCVQSRGEQALGGPPRTLVFDEVDAGIGGRTAEAVGRRLKRLASTHQVLCVTHLPQIACFADHHYFVNKREIHGRTAATVEELHGEERIREIGRMLSGKTLTPEALRHAERLLEMSARAR
ncbi:MAG: DNA repair protein RecN [Bryobacterales bacterium]|nr:DNA repair protein RecN [Bryobacteraceae bacterium]MDW8354010.1 DNA repair protein RecN [Bryobacterales bacterium]